MSWWRYPSFIYILPYLCHLLNSGVVPGVLFCYCTIELHFNTFLIIYCEVLHPDTSLLYFKVESSRHWRDNVTQRCRIDQLYGVSTTEATRSPIWLRHVKAKHWFISLFIDSFCPYFTSWCCMTSLIGWPPPESFCRSAISDKQCSYRAHSNLIWKCLTVSDISWSAASFIFLFLKICLMY